MERGYLLQQILSFQMNFIGKLQNEYEQLWKHIIRPPRSPYSQQQLGPAQFKLEGQRVQRVNVNLTNKRGFNFQCSLYIPVNKQSFDCVIYLHGNSSNRLEGVQYLGRLVRQGIGLCCFDFCGSGNAEGEYVSLGFYEQDDLEEVILFLNKYSKIKKISIWGRSMGAVTTLLYLKHAIRPVHAVVLDSPFKSLKALVEDLTKKNSKIPMFVLSAALKIISGTIQERAKFSIYALNPLKKCVKELATPAYFLVGKDDDIIPNDHTKELYASYAGEDKYLKLVKGGHNDSRDEEVINQIVEFLVQRFKQGVLEYQQTGNNPDLMDEELKTQQNEVNFFEEAQKNPQMVQTLKKEQFSFSSAISSMFSFGAKQKPKKAEVKDGYDQTRSIIATKLKSQKKSKKKKTKKEAVQQIQMTKTSDQILRQWSYTSI